MANINKIRISGTSYDIQDSNAPKVIELTQSEYDALTVKDPNAFYVITDSEYNFDGYWTSAQTQNAIAQSVSSKADTSAVTSVSDSLTAHTANTTVHVTAQDKTNWNAKSDFSGDYNDLTNKPTIPSKTSDLTNDSDFATTGDVQTATADMATKTWVGQQGYLTEHQSLSNYYTKSETSGATEISTALASKQSTLESGTNIKTINGESVLGSGNIEIEGGGKAIEAGRGISVTTGETADTVSFNLPISAGTGTNSIRIIDTSSKASGGYSFAGGSYSEARGIFSMAFGRYSITNNYGEVALGFFGKSNGSSNAPSQSSGNTLFSVGNGTNGYGGQHNAFEIRQNGDIYCSDGTNDVKLQDTITATAANTTALGGLSLVKLTQAQYDALATKDNSTLYVVTDS